MKLAIDSQVYGFTMLLYSQQLFNQMFVAEEHAEWQKIQPIVQELHNALSEGEKIKGRDRSIAYNGLDNLVFKGVQDTWYIMYCMTNYRVPGIDMHPDVATQHEKILYYVLVNICKKSHKNYHKFGSRFI